MALKWQLTFAILILTWTNCVDGTRNTRSRHQKPNTNSPGTCRYSATDNQVECFFLQEADMNLLNQTLLVASQLVERFGVTIVYSDGPSIPVDVFRGYNLSVVDLIGSQFGQLPYELLSNIETPLDDLYFIYNNFDSVETTATDLFLPFSAYLSQFAIEESNIEKIDPDTFKPYTHLQILFLGYNNINSIGLELLGLETLEELYLFSNNLCTIESGAFRDLKNLQLLHLDYNRLSNLQEGAFTGLETSPIYSITLDGNPWNCTCDLQWLKDWLNDRNLTQSSGASCLFPEVGFFNDVDFC